MIFRLKGRIGKTWSEIKSISVDVPEIERWLGQQTPVPIRWLTGRVMTASCRNTVKKLIKAECPEKKSTRKSQPIIQVWQSHSSKWQVNSGSLKINVSLEALSFFLLNVARQVHWPHPGLVFNFLNWSIVHLDQARPD